MARHLKRYRVHVESAIAEGDSRMIVSIDGPDIRGMTYARSDELAKFVETTLNAALDAFSRK